MGGGRKGDSGGKGDKTSGGGKGEKGGKAAQGGRNEKPSSWLTEKPYKKAVEETLKHTKVRPTDFDQKAVQLLDFLHTKEKAVEACNYLKQAADGVEREDIVNWRAYVYTLLKKSDEAAYMEMKEKAGGNRGGIGGRSKKDEAEFSLDAPEFVPGQAWSGNVTGSLIPGACGGASPPPPAWTPTVNFQTTQPSFFSTGPVPHYPGKGNPAGFDPRMGPPPPPPVPAGGLPGQGGKAADGKGKKGGKKGKKDRK